MSDKVTEVTLELHHETEKAYLFSDDGDREKAKWVPKSQVEIEKKRNDIYEVTMPVWLAAKNGWV